MAPMRLRLFPNSPRRCPTSLSGGRPSRPAAAVQPSEAPPTAGAAVRPKRNSGPVASERGIDRLERRRRGSCSACRRSQWPEEGPGSGHQRGPVSDRRPSLCHSAPTARSGWSACQQSVRWSVGTRSQPPTGSLAGRFQHSLVACPSTHCWGAKLNLRPALTKTEIFSKEHSYPAWANACSRSSRRSSNDSSPTESRISPSVMPNRARSAAS